ncbi:MAG: DNA polymerase III subunit delta' [Myxococcota bacterium]
MPLSAVLGQPRAMDTLRAALRGGSVHHAYLFGGPDGVGKELAAVGFAQALLCGAKRAGSQGPDACGTCDTCRRVEHRNHPDVTWVMPESELVGRGFAGRSDFDHTPSRDIRVEQVRALQERLALRALESPKKVAVLVEAQAMNTQAQNAFLKTLEEPPADTVLLLVASAPDKLLPTIRSRTSKVHFGPLPVRLLTERVKEARQVDDATAALVALMSAGSLSRALALDVAGLARRREVIERFEALQPADARGWLRFAEDFGGSRDEAEDALRVLALWLRDLAAVRSGAQDIANRDLLELARSGAQKAGEAALHRRLWLADQAHNAVTSRNGSPRLQLERMLIEMLTLL